MKARTRHALFIVVALIVGIAVGAWIYQTRQRAQAEALHSKTHLRVLALAGVFSKPLLEKLESESHLHVELVEAVDPESLWDIFDAPASTHFDVVTLMSYQVPAAIQMVRIVPLSAAKIDWSRVSSDFRAIPGDTNHNRVMPILWGLVGLLYNTQKFESAPSSWTDLWSDKTLKGRVGLLHAPIQLLRWTNKAPDSSGDEESDVGPSGQDMEQLLKPLLSVSHLSKTSLSSREFLRADKTPSPFSVVEMTLAEADFLTNDEKATWKMTLPSETSPLWILSLAITADSKLEKESYSLLEALTEPEFAKVMIEGNHQASTLGALDAVTTLPKAAKAISLRGIPLTKIQMQHDFQGARAVHAALEGESGITESTSE